MTACLLWHCDSFLLESGGGEWVRYEGLKFALQQADSSLMELTQF